MFEPEIARHHGRIFKLMGDGLLAEFGSVVEAVECAVSLQRGMAERNAAVTEEERFDVRIGINIGEVIVEGEDRYGEGVNVAARLEQLAPPGGIYVSGKVAKEVEKKLAFVFDPAGQRKVKNIDEPVDVYQVRIDAPSRRRAFLKRKPAYLWWTLGVPGAIVVLVAAWITFYHPLTATSPVSATMPAVAVLPFKDLSPDKSLGYLGDGVANDIITVLSRFPDIAVVSRTSSFGYKDKEGDVRQIGKDLGVEYILEGSVRKEGERIRIIAELIDAKTGDHVWADHFDRAGPDPWALQDEMTGKIVGAMTGETGAIRRADYNRAWGKDSTNLQEYDYYLRGHSQLMTYTMEGIEQSELILREGLKTFPESPLLLVNLGWAAMIKVLAFFNEPEANIEEAGRLANQVLSSERLSPQVAKAAHWLHAWVLILRGNHDGAVAEANKAISMAPYDALQLSDTAYIFLQAGDPEKALELADIAAERDPSLSWSFNLSRGWALILLGRYEDAVEPLKATELSDAPLALAIAYMRLGRTADAKAAVEKMLKANPKITIQTWRQTLNFRDPSILDQLAADLARAGLPE
ncbi:adenylate cyclase [Sinorhizobium fredii]